MVRRAALGCAVERGLLVHGVVDIGGVLDRSGALLRIVHVVECDGLLAFDGSRLHRGFTRAQGLLLVLADGERTEGGCEGESCEQDGHDELVEVHVKDGLDERYGREDGRDERDSNQYSNQYPSDKKHRRTPFRNVRDVLRRQCVNIL